MAWSADRMPALHAHVALADQRADDPMLRRDAARQTRVPHDAADHACNRAPLGIGRRIDVAV
jgi:hypothetical protein